MILENFGLGWKNKFEDILSYTVNLFPSLEIVSIERFHGMLRIKFKGLDKLEQFVLDSISHKIERQSVLVCEVCGENGRRRKDDQFLSEIKTLCWKCYALEVDFKEQHNSINQE